MFIRAKEELDLPAYFIRKGQAADLPADVAQPLIDSGKAVVVGKETAVKEIFGTELERAIDDPPAKGKREKSKANDKADDAADILG